MPYVDEKDVARKVMLILHPVIAERDKLKAENSRQELTICNLREELANTRLVLSRCGVGYKS